MKEKVQELKPQIACFNGKGSKIHNHIPFFILVVEMDVGIYEIFSGKTCSLGRQPEFFPGTKDTVKNACLRTAGKKFNVF